MLGFWSVGKSSVGGLLIVEVQGPVTITRPNSDLSVIGWTSSNGNPLYDDIDEETPSDADFITSPELTSTPVGATFGLTNSLSAGSYNISVRGRRTDTVGQMRVVLRDSYGDQVGATNWQTLTNTYTTYYFPITITGTATQSSVEARTENTVLISVASREEFSSTATTETSVLVASGVISDTNSITTTETSVLVPGGPVYVAGLFKTTYGGYFNDYLGYFDETSPYATSVQTTQILESSPPGDDYYSVQWLGYFKPTTTDTHTFFLNSDDGSYMWIGPTAVTGFDAGNALINNGGDHGEVEVAGSIFLTAGQYYPIRIMFGEAEGDALLQFNYRTPLIAKTTNVTGLVFYNSSTNGF